ncbi:DUF4271 domain-containing protein [Sphingobacterium sp. HJSM2_6]|uniref:DUF4271 domain-containing protein n=1 Tax=Sphingobacterium sp. HJSM2_6 TaxID=3366264 RepID=UPI003BD153B0
MKKLILIHLFIILYFLAGAAIKAASAQTTLADSLQGTNTSILPDSIADLAGMNLVDSSFKYTYIIDQPLNKASIFQQEVQRILKNGKHDLLFDIPTSFKHEDIVPTNDGQQKQSRPIWVLFVVTFLFIVLGVLRIIFPVELKIIVDAYYKERLLIQVSKEDNLATSWPYIFLYVIFSLSLGLFVVLLISNFNDYKYLTFENFIKNSGFIALLFIAKILLIRFVSFVFLLEKIVREYIAILYLIYFNSMFILLPFLLAVVFLPTIYFTSIAIIYAICVFLLFTYRFVRTAFHLFGNFKFSIFYLILYLCSLELAPILILVRSLSN